jgi:large exoprotein involved in heme utilization and adhesion
LRNDSKISGNVWRGARGNGGNITLTGRSLTLSGNSQISANTNEQGNTGDISIITTEGIELNGNGSQISSKIDARGTGNGGTIFLQGTGLTLNGGSITSQVEDNLDYNNNRRRLGGGGTAASIVISMGNGAILIDGGEGINANLYGEGRGGDITIQSGVLTLQDGARIRAQTFGLVPGRADAGDVQITVDQLILKDGAQIETSTVGKEDRKNDPTDDRIGGGQGGNITIRANLIDLDGYRGNPRFDNVQTTGIFSTVNLSQGTGGTIQIDTGRLRVYDGAQVSANTLSYGNGGAMTITARESVILERTNRPDGYTLPLTTLLGTGLVSETNFSTRQRQVPNLPRGEAGSITVTTPQLDIRNGATISAVTRTAGRDGGTITLNTDTVNLASGGQVLTTSFDSGAAGNITVNATGDVTVAGRDADFARRQAVLNDFAAQFRPLRNDIQPNLPRDRGGLPISAESGFFASTLAGATGVGGSIAVTANQVTVENGGQISARSAGTGSAGNVKVTAPQVSLTGGQITTESNTGGGGGIELRGDRLTLTGGQITTASTNGNSGSIQLNFSDVVLLRQRSEISTRAGGNGQGGNIDLNTRFLIGIPNENSDIIADAFNGLGGNVTITAQSLFGIAPLSRAELGRRLGTTDPNQLDPRNLSSNDITAISQNNPTLNGQTLVNTPDIDPNRGLVPLPANSLDPSRQIAQGCQYAMGNNRFVALGNGGLPSDPTMPGIADDRIIRLAQLPLDLSELPTSSAGGSDAIVSAVVPPILEAQGVERLANGKIRFVGQPAIASPSWPTANCQTWRTAAAR